MITIRMISECDYIRIAYSLSLLSDSQILKHKPDSNPHKLCLSSDKTALRPKQKVQFGDIKIEKGK